MTQLTDEEMLYLFYAEAYSQAGTVTKGEVKSQFPSGSKEKAEKLYDGLKQKALIEPADKNGKTTNEKGEPVKERGRFTLTTLGRKVLVSKLAGTSHDFSSSKSYRVLNTLINCLFAYIKDADQATQMNFDEFREKFKALYLEERKQQELQGVVAIHSQELCKKFVRQYSISEEKLRQYFEQLKKNGEILTVIEKDIELISIG